MNPIICLVRNNAALTKLAIRSFRQQDIEGGVDILIVNNDSTDGVTEWMNTQEDLWQMVFSPQIGVAAGWNRALDYVFRAGAEYAFVVNNDVELRPETYRLLVEDGGGFVTAVGRREWPEVVNAPSGERRPHPDFSCYVIRRRVYEQVGAFDEGFKIAFCEDWDYHVRLHKASITAYCIDLPFLHHGSMTVKLADLAERHRIQKQADRNRAYFKAKWGMAGASPEYYAFFGNTAPVEHHGKYPVSTL